MTTHHGDHGETSLYDGTRVTKADARIEALGAVDELNSWLGFGTAQRDVADIGDRLRWVQERLLEVGADLANPGGRARSTSLAPGSLQTLDGWLVEYRDALPPPAAFHRARRPPARRRASRCAFRVPPRRTPGMARGRVAGAGRIARAFLNRLSDVLFEMARVANASTGTEDPVWRGRADS